MSELSDFLEKKKQEYKKKQDDMVLVKSEWILQVNDLLSYFKKWLKEPEEKGLVTISEKDIELCEEYIGTYKISSLEILIGADRVQITPVGRFVVGAEGRVDIHSMLNRYNLLYLSEKGWLFRAEGKNEKFQQLTEEGFTKILKDLV